MLYVKIALGGIFLLVCFALILAGSIFVYGTTLPERKTITRVAVINAPPGRVYDIAIDAEGQAGWRGDVAGITVTEARGGQARKWIEHTRQGDVHFAITAEDRPRSFSLGFHSDSGFIGAWEGRFAAQNQGAAGAAGAATRVTLTEHITIANPLFRGIAHRLKITERFMDKYIANLTAEAEKRAGN